MPNDNIDHINGNGLDNRRENLRFCTHAQNTYNKGKYRKTGESPYKGVHKLVNGRYLVKIGYKKKSRSYGQFDDPIEAARVYDFIAKMFFGEYARLNFLQ